MKRLTFLLLITCCSASFVGRRVRNRGITTEDDGEIRTRRKYFPVSVRRESPEERIAIARQHAIQVIVEKMFRALGQDFPQEPNMTLPISDVMPTVANVSSITADPCPDIYTKCSSESFLPSCSPPNESNPIIWKKMYNLYFPIPEDLFESDNLLNATLQLYKNNTLPLDDPTLLIIELYAYTGNISKRREYITSTNVTSDYIGWISLDITDLVENLNQENNHGIHIKVKEHTGIYWNDLSTFTAMDCTNNTNFIALPLGVHTNQPEPKFPSLNIRTGTPEQPYPELPIDSDNLLGYYNGYNSDDSYSYDTDILEPDEFNFTMPGDDPNVSRDHINTHTYRSIDEFNLPEIYLPPKQIDSPIKQEIATESIPNVQLNMVDNSGSNLKFESVEDDGYELNWHRKPWPYHKRTSQKKRNRHKKQRKSNKKGKRNYHSHLL